MSASEQGSITRNMPPLSLALCDHCRDAGILDMFTRADRNPEVDGDYRHKVNNLANALKQKKCAFCQALVKVISDTPGLDLLKAVQPSQPSPDIYVGPHRTDHALCGAELRGNKASEVSTCMDVEIDGLSLHGKIFLTRYPPDRKSPWSMYDVLVRPGGLVDFHVLKQWLQVCIDGHEECSRVMHPEADPEFEACQRLIDVKARRIVHKRLDQTRYAALSYVWGPALEQFDEESSSSLSRNLPAILPQTITDAIMVCEKLKIDYIWIDAYCIDQSDPHDKSVLICNMDLIYQMAHVTIIAAAGDSPTHGLEGVSIARTNHTENDAETLAFEVVTEFHPPFQRWSMRAWTLQETLLSRRLLVFEERYALYYCRGAVMRDDLSHSGDGKGYAEWLPFDGSIFNFGYQGQKFNMGTYCNLPSLYCHRDMSDPTDALNAVSGLLKLWTRSDGIQFLVGLPESELGSSLLWVGSLHVLRGHPTLPTWSWTSWRGDISYPVVSFGMEPEGQVRTRRRYNCNLANPDTVLKPRIFHWYQPGTINFGTGVEQEANINIIRERNETPVLSIQSYIGSFELKAASAITSGTANKEKLCLHRNPDDNTYTVSPSYGNMESWNNIKIPEDLVPDDTSQEAFASTLSFVLIKKWYRIFQTEDPKLHQVWVLLVAQGAYGKAKRLGCLRMSPELWESGSIRQGTVIFE